MLSLTHDEAVNRARLLTVRSYLVDLDLTCTDAVFESVSTVRFDCALPGSTSFAELVGRLRSATLNGRELPLECQDNRLPLPDLAAEQRTGGRRRTGLLAHRRGAAPVRRPRRRRDLPVRDELPGQRAAHLLLLRPARPEGAADAVGDRAGGLDGAGQRYVPAVTAVPRALGVRATRPIAHVHGDGCRRAVPCPAVPTHDGSGSAGTAGARWPSTWTPTPRSCSPSPGSASTAYHELFGVRYPFGDSYDQAFVPEFNAGAMENPGLRHVPRRAAVPVGGHRGRAGVAGRDHRARDGAHVVRRPGHHALVGRPVAQRVVRRLPGVPGRRRGDPVHRTPGPASPVRRKALRVRRGPRPSTHPVAPTRSPTPRTRCSTSTASPMRRAPRCCANWWPGSVTSGSWPGCGAYFAAHAYGNATLADLLDSLSAASGRDLAGWAERVAAPAGVNTLLPAVTVDAEGRYTEVTVRQTAPDGAPELRPHRIGVGLYRRRRCAALSRSARRGRRSTRPSDGGTHPGTGAAGTSRPADLLLLNDGDLTFAKVRLDPASADSVPDAAARAAPTRWPGRCCGAHPGRGGRRGAARRRPGRAGRRGARRRRPRWSWCEDVLNLPARWSTGISTGPPGEIALGHVVRAVRRVLAAAEPGGRLQLAAARGLIGASADRPLLPAGWPAPRLPRRAGARRRTALDDAAPAGGTGRGGRARDRRGVGRATAAPRARSAAARVPGRAARPRGQGRGVAGDVDRPRRCPTGWSGDCGGLLAARAGDGHCAVRAALRRRDPRRDRWSGRRDDGTAAAASDTPGSR